MARNRFDKGPYCYDEVMRIPLIVRMPGAKPRVIDRHVPSIDVNRTLCEWMQLQPDEPNLDSRSLTALIRDGDRGWAGPDEAYYRYEWYNGLWFGIRGVRTKEYKYSFNPCRVDELYDLQADPGEIENLASDRAMRLVMRGLQLRLIEHLRRTEDTMLQAKLAEAMQQTVRRAETL